MNILLFGQRQKSRVMSICLICMSMLTMLISPSLYANEAQPLPTDAVKTSIEANSITQFDDTLAKLRTNNLKEKQAALIELADFDDARLNVVLNALLSGSLYATPENFYIKQKQASKTSYVLLDDPANILTKKPKGLKKVIVNNRIRLWIKERFAVNQLLDKRDDVRLKAMQQVMNMDDSSTVKLVRKVLPHESNSNIKLLMNRYLARVDLQQADYSRHAAAILILADGASQENLSLLKAYLAKAPTPQLKKEAQKAISSIENKMLVLNGVETLTFGLSLGSILIITAIGLAITFGVMGVINMAHGELLMLGAYTTYVVQQLMPNHIGLSLLVAVPAAFLVSGFIGVLIERFVVRYLYGRPLETLLATFGVSLVLQQAVRSIFSPLNRKVQSPEWMSGTWQITEGLGITYNRIYIFIFCMLCFFALLMIIKRTRLGLEVNAVSQNRFMARAMGINDRRVDMMTFGLGAGVSGVAGVALSQLTNVGPNLGQQYIVDSFMVVVVGGVGNLWGTFVSGLTLGILNKFFEPWLGAVLAKSIILVLIILFIQKYPRGLFPQKGRAVE